MAQEIKSEKDSSGLFEKWFQLLFEKWFQLHKKYRLSNYGPSSKNEYGIHFLKDVEPSYYEMCIKKTKNMLEWVDFCRATMLNIEEVRFSEIISVS